MLSDVRALLSDGTFARALDLATARSVELVREGHHDDASRALALAAEILCTLNQPLRARAFAAEALEMAQASGDAGLQCHARAAGVLALLRLGEIDKAEVELGGALPSLCRGPRQEPDPLALLVGAEVALATGKTREARAFATSTFAAATAANDVVYRARATLILGVCAIRERGYKAALRPLMAAVAELQLAPHAETFWQVHAALAGVSRKLGRAEQASRHQALAAASAQGVVDALPPPLRDHFLRNPTVQAALGAGARSGWSRIPPPIAASILPRREGDSHDVLGPFLEAFRRIDAQRDMRELLPVVVESMIALCGAQRGTIAIFDGDTCREEVSRAEQAQGFQPFEMSVARAVLRIVRETHQPFLADDVRTSPALDVRADRLLSVLSVPLRVKHEILGAVYLDTPGASGAFDARDLEVAEILADRGAVALENVLVHDHAIRDGLTLLYNQSHVEECLEREIVASRRHGRPCGVLMVDIDDFKRTNDGMGHAAGNDLLRALAPMLSGAVRSLDMVARIEARAPSAIVARYGGDEFEIVLPDTGREGLSAVAGRILEAVRVTSFPHDARTFNVTVSIGGACFPGDAGSARELMRRADEALYHAKQAGKNRYQACAGG